MSAWPKEIVSKTYQTSDGEVFLDEREAKEHERKLGLRALCDSVFGVDGTGFYGSLGSEDIYAALEQHRDLFLTWMSRDRV